MIPKELHLNHIVETFIEELARFPQVTAEDWAMVEKAAAIWALKFPRLKKQKTLWDWIRHLVKQGGGTNPKQERERLQKIWLAKGRNAAVSSFWRHKVCHLSCLLVREEERRNELMAEALSLAASKARRKPHRRRQSIPAWLLG